MPLWKRNLLVCLFGAFATTAGFSTVLPFLPLYIEQLGISDKASIVQWSGLAFGVSYLVAAFISPFWGKLADRYGRKPMLLRASLGQALIMTLVGFVGNVQQLVGLRLLMGLVAGYIPASITLVATRTPTARAGWALGILSTGAVAGTLIGPLIGGWLAEIIGLRHTFFITGAFMFAAFTATACLVKEEFQPPQKKHLSAREIWRLIHNPRMVATMFVASFVLQMANLSIEPIITVYIQQLTHARAHVALIAGLVVSAAAFASMLAAPRLGRLADRVGPKKVLLTCLVLTAFTLVPQAWVQSPWQLMGLRFLMGLTLAGLLPCINMLLKQSVPDQVAGRVFGYNQSANFLGMIAGPLFGSQIAAHLGMAPVFYATGAILLLNAVWNVWIWNGKRATAPGRVGVH